MEIVELNRPCLAPEGNLFGPYSGISDLNFAHTCSLYFHLMLFTCFINSVLLSLMHSVTIVVQFFHFLWFSCFLRCLVGAWNEKLHKTTLSQSIKAAQNLSATEQFNVENIAPIIPGWVNNRPRNNRSVASDNE